MTDLAKLVVRLEAETAKYQAELGKAQKKLGNFEKKSSEDLKKLGKQFGQLAGSAATGMGAVVAAVTSGARDIANQARVANAGAEEFQRLAFGGKVSGQNFGVSPGMGGRFNITKLAATLEDVHERLAGVIIENLRWQDFIARYDRPGVLFYLDPPYFGNEQDYGTGMFSRDQFAEMANALKSLKGRFVMSINDRPEIRELFAGFEQHEVQLTYTLAGGINAKKARELVIVG